jgi:hypothetical protein
MIDRKRPFHVQNLSEHLDAMNERLSQQTNALETITYHSDGDTPFLQLQTLTPHKSPQMSIHPFNPFTCLALLLGLEQLSPFQFPYLKSQKHIKPTVPSLASAITTVHVCQSQLEKPVISSLPSNSHLHFYLPFKLPPFYPLPVLCIYPIVAVPRK